jgi:hypothetical protein
MSDHKKTPPCYYVSGAIFKEGKSEAMAPRHFRARKGRLVDHPVAPRPLWANFGSQ